MLLVFHFKVFSDKFTTYIMQGMKEASSKKNKKNIKVIYVDAQNDSAKQLSQVETFY
ncbi:hypothetical protein GCM10020331_100840 [Ectobacillus funiculus]